MALENRYDTAFVAALARREKQIQQVYRPIIGIHKWFARRPGTLFRALLLGEFSDEPLESAFFKGNSFPQKVIADPFMGGGTSVIEANRLGMGVIGIDLNPMAYWIVRQALATLDLKAFERQAHQVADLTEQVIGRFYNTQCVECGSTAVVKYFLWVKQQECTGCGAVNDLFPGFLIATNDRHEAFVWHCPTCGRLFETSDYPDNQGDVCCPHCRSFLPVDLTAAQGRFKCRACGSPNRYPVRTRIPRHRLFAIEYYCPHCRGTHKGRYFKAPDKRDLAAYAEAAQTLLSRLPTLVPEDEIPEGDETSRLRRWGYRRYRDLFNERQLLGLETLMKAISQVPEAEIRFALATVFSDMLRYQNMLCRYDVAALKCQDVFSVHGFPVSLIQCENNLLGIPGVGSGGFRHFVEKYIRAKEYCVLPFEFRVHGRHKKKEHTWNERIEGRFADSPDAVGPSGAYLAASDARALALAPESLDGVFTDPPYYDNVQYAELMDFCYVWLRRLLREEVPAFAAPTTRDSRELTGNATSGRDIYQFTTGLSAVFCNMAAALKPHAPFVFTYHHNNAEAYLPVIVAILDAGLICTATFACPAEMAASLHINGTSSSTVDTVFVCRKERLREAPQPLPFPQCLRADVSALARAGVRVTQGDITCMALGHLSRMAIHRLRHTWDPSLPVEERFAAARRVLGLLLADYRVSDQTFLEGVAREIRLREGA